MGLIDAAQAAEADGKRRGCGLGRLRASLTGDVLKELDTLIGDSDRYSNTVVAAALAAEGLTFNGRAINYQVVQRHRLGRCTCVAD